MFLSCKVPSDRDHFLGQKFAIFFCFLFSVFDERPPKRIARKSDFFRCHKSSANF